jgi:hypothetical protein
MFMRQLLSQTGFNHSSDIILSGILSGDQFKVISNDQRDHSIKKISAISYIKVNGHSSKAIALY